MKTVINGYVIEGTVEEMKMFVGNANPNQKVKLANPSIPVNGLATQSLKLKDAIARWDSHVKKLNGKSFKNISQALRYLGLGVCGDNSLKLREALLRNNSNVIFSGKREMVDEPVKMKKNSSWLNKLSSLEGRNFYKARSLSKALGVHLNSNMKRRLVEELRAKNIKIYLKGVDVSTFNDCKFIRNVINQNTLGNQAAIEPDKTVMALMSDYLNIDAQESENTIKSIVQLGKLSYEDSDLSRRKYDKLAQFLIWHGKRLEAELNLAGSFKIVDGVICFSNITDSSNLIPSPAVENA